MHDAFDLNELDKEQVAKAFGLKRAPYVHLTRRFNKE